MATARHVAEVVTRNDKREATSKTRQAQVAGRAPEHAWRTVAGNVLNASFRSNSPALQQSARVAFQVFFMSEVLLLACRLS